MPRLVVPDALNRNSRRVAKHPPERTGKLLLDLVLAKLGWPDFSRADVLDVGCGVRFAQTFLNLDLPLGTYTGVDVYRPLIDFLRKVSDSRFSFAHWDVHNAMYNPACPARMQKSSELPVTGAYDLVWLFSVFTHLAPDDADAMLAILRRYVRPEGRLFFTAFIGDQVEPFEDRDADQPLRLASYRESFLRELVTRNRWHIASFDPRDRERFIQHHLVCVPA